MDDTLHFSSSASGPLPPCGGGSGWGVTTGQAPACFVTPHPNPPPQGGRGQDGRGPIRVCFLIDRLTRAGTETQLLALIRALDRRRVAPALVLLDGTDAASR